MDCLHGDGLIIASIGIIMLASVTSSSAVPVPPSGRPLRMGLDAVEEQCSKAGDTTRSAGDCPRVLPLRGLPTSRSTGSCNCGNAQIDSTRGGKELHLYVPALARDAPRPSPVTLAERNALSLRTWVIPNLRCWPEMADSANTVTRRARGVESG